MKTVAEQLGLEVRVVKNKYISGRSNTITGLGADALLDETVDTNQMVPGSVTNSIIADETIIPQNIANRTRKISLSFFADEFGGAVRSNNWADEVAFTGTPSGYARAHTRIPSDWVSGTDLYFILRLRAATTATAQASVRYVGAYADGENSSGLWNIESAVSSNITITSNLQTAVSITVASAGVSADDQLALAWRPNWAITGTVYLADVSLQYTSDSQWLIVFCVKMNIISSDG